MSELPTIAPRTPASTLTPVEPAQETPVKSPRKLPEGWWAVDAKHPGHKGSKADVIAQIEACEQMDADFKTFLLAKIKASPCQALKVHAQCQVVNGHVVIHCHIDPLF